MSKETYKNMPYPGMRPNPNPDIKNFGQKGGLATSSNPISKFRRELGKFKREKVPYELLSLYDWYKGLDKREIDYLLEIKNMYKLLQDITLPRLIDKALHGEDLTKNDIQKFKLLTDMMEKSHKLKYGDKKVIEKVVTMKDVRKAIFADKKVIDVKVINNGPVSQDLDRTRHSEEPRENETSDDSDEDSP